MYGFRFFIGWWGTNNFETHIEIRVQTVWEITKTTLTLFDTVFNLMPYFHAFVPGIATLSTSPLRCWTETLGQSERPSLPSTTSCVVSNGCQPFAHRKAKRQRWRTSVQTQSTWMHPKSTTCLGRTFIMWTWSQASSPNPWVRICHVSAARASESVFILV